ncbi:MAG: hypothetical protein ABMA64_06430 [Myxococcota bacterium]
MWTAVIPWTVWSGCLARVSLSEVPISGGTDEQRAAIRAELARFDEWFGPGRVELAQVRMASGVPRGAAGAYHVNTAVIEIDAAAEPPLVAAVLGHELCHALDHQEGLLSDPDELWDRLGDELAAAWSEQYVDGSPSGNARYRRSEAFAIACQAGPVEAELVTAPCPGDPPELAEIGAWLMERVWHTELPPPVPASGAARVELDLTPWPAFADEAHLTLYAKAPGVMWLDPLGYDDEPLFFELATGQVVPRPDDAYPAAHCSSADFEVVPWVGGSVVRGGCEGQQLGTLGFAVFGGLTDHSAPRAFWYDTREWHRVDGMCPTWDVSARSIQGADGQVWLFERQGPILSWIPFVDEVLPP